MYVMLLALMYWWPSNTGNTGTSFLWVVAVVTNTRFPDESEIMVTLSHYTCDNCISICLTDQLNLTQGLFHYTSIMTYTHTHARTHTHIPLLRDNS